MIHYYNKKNYNKKIKNNLINFVYLLVFGCNGYDTDYEGIPKLNYSIKSLRKNYNNINKIYVYSGYDETNIHRMHEIEIFCKENNLIFVNFGKLKHLFNKSEREHSNPFQISILIEKIYILKNHPIDENICFVDCDTEFNNNMKNYIFELDKPIFHAKEYLLLYGYRNLDNFFKHMVKNIDPSTYMFNSGIIYIPNNLRVQIASEAIDLVLEMNNYKDSLRICNRLDEQIALSIYIYKYYKNNINLLENCVKHYWSSVNNDKYWLK